MQVDHEIIPYDQNKYANIILQKIGYSRPHWHSSLELILVLENQATISFRNKDYHLGENDIIVVNPNLVHSLTGEDAVLLVIQISPDFLLNTPYHLQDKYFDCCSSVQNNPIQFNEIRRLMAKMLKQSTMTDAYAELMMMSYITELLHILFSCFLAASIVEHPNEKNIETLQTVMNYIDAHYQETITVESLASMVYLTPAYLSTFFEKNVGMTLTGYIRNRRITHALDMLRYTDASIEEIGESSGFASSRSFSDSFRKLFGILPSQFRKEGLDHVEKKLPEFATVTGGYLNVKKEDYFNRLDAYLKREEQKLPINRYPIQRISLDRISSAKYLGRNKGAAGRFCSVSRASDILIAEVQEMLKEQQRDIHFEYIKFHDIFDDALQVYREDHSGRPLYNFHMIDRILDFLLSIDLKPMIQLSFMPALLAGKSDSDSLTECGLNTVRPKDPARWEALVREFIRHLILRYGKNCLNRWIFTFWNESLSGLHFDFENDDLFFDMYERTYHAVKDLLPETDFASTSFLLIYRPLSDFIRYVDYMKSHKCMADSFLIHFYPIPSMMVRKNSDLYPEHLLAHGTDEARVYGPQSKDPDALSHYLDMILPLIPAGKKVYMPEWNMTPIHRELLNDTVFSGTYYVRNILKNLNRTDALGHWVLSDWITEVGFPDRIFHGGLGLFTYNGVKKPPYFAFLFASRLQKNIIYNDNRICITVDDDRRRYAMLMYNYTHFSDFYADGFNFDFSELERYNIFPNPAEQIISFTLTGLEKGDYRIIQHVVNREHGSAFDTWLRMGAAEPTTEEELQELRSLSGPMPFIHREKVEEDSFPFHFHMQPHEFRFVLFERLF